MLIYITFLFILFAGSDFNGIWKRYNGLEMRIVFLLIVYFAVFFIVFFLHGFIM